MLSVPHDDPRLGRNSVHTVEVMGKLTCTKVRARAGRASAFTGPGAAQVARLHRGAHLARDAYRGMLVEGCYDHVSYHELSSLTLNLESYAARVGARKSVAFFRISISSTFTLPVVIYGSTSTFSDEISITTYDV